MLMHDAFGVRKRSTQCESDHHHHQHHQWPSLPRTNNHHPPSSSSSAVLQSSSCRTAAKRVRYARAYNFEGLQCMHECFMCACICVYVCLCVFMLHASQVLHTFARGVCRDGCATVLAKLCVQYTMRVACANAHCGRTKANKYRTCSSIRVRQQPTRRPTEQRSVQRYVWP